MSKPQVKRINIYDSTQHRNSPENFNEYINWCEDMLRSIPDENRDTARIETDYDTYYDGCGGEQGFAFVTINYWRDETNGEKFEREAEETIRQRKLHDKERIEYERLKEKYKNVMIGS